MALCNCGSGKQFESCCEPFLIGKERPKTPEQLMRSRYTAYTLHDADYLISTTHKSQREYFSKPEILKWATTNTWIKLEVLWAKEHQVAFKAYFFDENLQAQVHYEKSDFKNENGVWYYVDGEFN